MNKLGPSVVLSSAIALLPALAAAEEAAAPAATPPAAAAPAAPAPDYTLSANVFLVSNYFFRGLTQTWDKAAIQGGADFTYKGVYLGTWASNVSGQQYAGGSMEWDFYGGYLHKLNDDLNLGGGLLYYYYPGANYNNANPPGADQTYNTLEANVQVNWKWLQGKVSVALTDYFGANSKTGFNGGTAGTWYPEVNVNYPLNEHFTLVGHLGYTGYASNLSAPNASGKTDPSYWDWKLGVSWVWKDGWTLGAYYVGTSNTSFYEGTVGAANGQTKDLGGNNFYVTAGRTF